MKKSIIDAALLLTNQVEVNKTLGLKTSVVLLDVKGAFNHVAKNQLLRILKELRLLIYLISWIKSFLEDRILKLVFNGQIKGFSLINTGIPQGSPISPILFLIYTRNLYKFLNIKVFSYIEDIALIVSSTGFKKNVKILEREISKLYDLGAKEAIQFDISKTELIYFSKTKAAKAAILTLPNQEILQPKNLVR